MLSLILAAAFSVVCPQLQCTFDASASTGAVSYLWNWGNGRPVESRTVAMNKNTYAALGIYAVTLTVADSAGHRASITKWIKVPTATDGSVPPPVHDTVTIARVDTVQLPAPPAVHDTVIVGSGALPSAVRIENAFGGGVDVWMGQQYVGRVEVQTVGAVYAYRYTGAMPMPIQGPYLTQIDAVWALLKAPPPDVVP
jgi:PKD domain